MPLERSRRLQCGPWLKLGSSCQNPTRGGVGRGAPDGRCAPEERLGEVWCESEAGQRREQGSAALSGLDFGEGRGWPTVRSGQGEPIG